jgi:hypothetical protein
LTDGVFTTTLFDPHAEAAIINIKVGMIKRNLFFI